MSLRIILAGAASILALAIFAMTNSIYQIRA
jgi:hypothetical protein